MTSQAMIPCSMRLPSRGCRIVVRAADPLARPGHPRGTTANWRTMRPDFPWYQTSASNTDRGRPRAVRPEPSRCSGAGRLAAVNYGHSAPFTAPTLLGKADIREVRLTRLGKLMFQWCLVVAMALAISGCGPTVVVMKNPKTGELIQCHGQNTGEDFLIDQSAAKDCANGYQAAGWQRMN
jgi:hypothetical protein